MKILTFTSGPAPTHSYIVFDEKTKDAVVIDGPPEVADQMLPAIEENGLNVSKIVLSHAHWDHVVDLDKLSKALGAPVASHRDVVKELEAVGANTSIPYTFDLAEPTEFLDEGDVLEIGEGKLVVMHMPGHAPGQIALHDPDQKVVFSGDMLHAGGFGPLDLDGSVLELGLQAFSRLLSLPDDTTIYAGHGKPTTIGAERGMMEQAIENKSARAPGM